MTVEVKSTITFACKPGAPMIDAFYAYHITSGDKLDEVIFWNPGTVKRSLFSTIGHPVRWREEQ